MDVLGEGRTLTPRRNIAARVPRALVALLLGCVVGVGRSEPARGRLLFEGDRAAVSNNGKYYADPDPRWKSTQVFRWVQNRPELVWEKPGFTPATFLSDDGEYMVAGDRCEGHAHRKFSMDLEVATFYQRKRPIRSLRLRDLIVDRRSIKNGHWGRCMGFLEGEGHRFAIDTVEHRRLVFDVTKGNLVETLPSDNRFPNID